MRRVRVIGIGAGNPEHMTVQAIDALNTVDVVFVFDKGERAADLVRIREEICARFIKDRAYRIVHAASPERDASDGYKAGVAAWHREKAAIFAALIEKEIPDGSTGGFLVWGDPALYDSTLRILDDVRAGGLAFDYDVIPGISSVQVLAAAHRIPLHAIGEPVTLTTGRKLRDGWPVGADSVVVLLDNGDGLNAIAGEDVEIFWGAYLGTPDEVLVAGRLPEVIGNIRRIRAEKRGEKGWIMDVYMLRRPR